MIAELKTKDAIRALLDSIDCFLFDCDGVIWLGDTLVPYVAETLQLLRSLGKKILFVSNNSTKSRLQYKHKFDRLNLVASEVKLPSESTKWRS